MIPQIKQEETFYDILKVDRKATMAEIVAAYHTAKNAFSKDSIATYSLFNTEEVKAVIDRLEEAFQTLSNIDKKRAYDRWLEDQSQNPAPPPAMTELEKKQNAQLLPRESENVFPLFATQATDDGTSSKSGATVDSSPIALPDNNCLTGAQLKEIREKRGLTLEDVSRITKIPTKFIRAIEADDFKRFPARVYLQGFIKNMATLYRLDVKATVHAYLTYADPSLISNP